MKIHLTQFANFNSLQPYKVIKTMTPEMTSNNEEKKYYPTSKWLQKKSAKYKILNNNYFIFGSHHWIKNFMLKFKFQK